MTLFFILIISVLTYYLVQWIFKFDRVASANVDLSESKRQLEERALSLGVKIAELESELELIKSQSSISSDEIASLKAEVHEQEVTIKRLNLKADEQIAEINGLKAGRDSVVEKIVNHYVNDSFKLLCEDVTVANFESQKRKFEKIIDNSRRAGVDFDPADVNKFNSKLSEKFKFEIRCEEDRQRRDLIKERIREEVRLEKQRQDDLSKIETNLENLQTLLKEMQTNAKSEDSAEIVLLKARLAEAEDRLARAKSQAQITKAGYVYVISNIGSFGENVFKVGMTRRLVPEERIKELGDASVPFPYDVHMMIACEDAPKLEFELHKNLHKKRINRVNHRKEFFRVDIEEIVDCVIRLHGEIVYRAEPKAIEYRETLLRQNRSEFDEFSEELTYTGDEQIEVA